MGISPALQLGDPAVSGHAAYRSTVRGVVSVICRPRLARVAPHRRGNTAPAKYWSEREAQGRSQAEAQAVDARIDATSLITISPIDFHTALRLSASSARHGHVLPETNAATRPTGR